MTFPIRSIKFWSTRSLGEIDTGHAPDHHGVDVATRLRSAVLAVVSEAEEVPELVGHDDGRGVDRDRAVAVLLERAGAVTGRLVTAGLGGAIKAGPVEREPPGGRAHDDAMPPLGRTEVVAARGELELQRESVAVLVRKLVEGGAPSLVEDLRPVVDQRHRSVGTRLTLGAHDVDCDCDGHDVPVRVHRRRRSGRRYRTHEKHRGEDAADDQSSHSRHDRPDGSRPLRERRPGPAGGTYGPLRVADSMERRQLLERIARLSPQFAGVVEYTRREIPVVVLDHIESPA